MSETSAPPTGQGSADPRATERGTGGAVGTDPAGEPGGSAVASATQERVGGLWSDAWKDLRHNPLFLVAGLIIVVMLLIAAFPGLFTSVDPAAGDLSRSNQPPSAQAIFGYDLQGYDVYSRTIHGARYSIIVGVLSTLGTTLVGMTVGMLAAYYGRWIDTLLSRVSDVFLGIPFLLGAIVILTTFNQFSSPFAIVGVVVAALVALGWPVPARVMRSAVIQTKQNDYVAAARSMGASTGRIIFKHLLPNALAASLVYATISLGAFIGAEATLSFLGIGLRAPVISWGSMISDASSRLRDAPHALLFPAGFLVLTVLAFVLLGDAVRQALDPKLR
jgi:oligopeptide transport system permease protein